MHTFIETELLNMITSGCEEHLLKLLIQLQNFVRIHLFENFGHAPFMRQYLNDNTGNNSMHT